MEIGKWSEGEKWMEVRDGAELSEHNIIWTFFFPVTIMVVAVFSILIGHFKQLTDDEDDDELSDDVTSKSRMWRLLLVGKFTRWVMLKEETWQKLRGKVISRITGMNVEAAGDSEFMRRSDSKLYDNIDVFQQHSMA